MSKNTNTGRILQCVGGYYKVYDGINYHVCRARGNFRARNITPMVGDYVEYNPPETESGGYILEVINRKNFLLRPLVANIDTLMITISPKKPRPDMQLVDILMINATKLNIDVCLIVNKCDLDIKESQRLIDCFPHIENKFMISAVTKVGIDELKEICTNRTLCFAGQSGVGKTSILNCILPELNFEVGDISRKTQRGKHTTRQADLIEFNGGYIVDSPGFSMLDLELVEPETLKDYYLDFLEYADGCKFNGCMHYSEPNCAVIAAVKANEIDPLRHKRYMKILDDMRERWKRRYD